MKFLLALALVLVVSDACAQSRQFYDATGRKVGSSSTDSQGSTTFYDAAGKVTGKSSTSGNTTTIYDPSGRNVGRATRGAR
jgi:YD repeat-containing protein